MKDDKHRSASIWLANMLVYLSVDIICFLKFVFPQASLSENCRLLRKDEVCRPIFEHTLAQIGGQCLNIEQTTTNRNNQF